MIVIPVKTRIVNSNDNLFDILDDFLPKLHEKDVIAVTSKIVAICEKRVKKIDKSVDKKQLIKDEADFFIDDPRMSKYNILLTIKNNNLVASAGIDESNGNGNYIFWPVNPDKSADLIWKHIKKTRKLKYLGVVITDSRTTPLKWGVTGFGISWCGFEPIKNYTNTPDIFGRPFAYEQTSIVDSLAAAGAFVMGEGNEQTPLSVIRNAPHVVFTDHVPTQTERNSLKISLEDDIYAPLSNSNLWQKGGKR